MIFGTIDISGRGPFAQEQIIGLRGGRNVVQGANGTGKTTIATTLLGVFQDSYTDQKLPSDIATRLVLIDEGYTWERFAPAMLKYCFQQSQQSFEHSLASSLNTLMAHKILSGRSKFGATEHRTLPLQLKISKGGRILVSDSSGRDMTSCFLHLANNSCSHSPPILPCATRSTFANRLLSTVILVSWTTSCLHLVFRY